MTFHSNLLKIGATAGLVVALGLFSGLMTGCQTTSTPRVKDVDAALPQSTVGEINETKAQTVAVPFDTCKPEKGVNFKGSNATRLTTEEIEKLLLGNTVLSVDRYGTFSIYYPTKGKTIGWMPKEKSKGYSWSAGEVAFQNDKYCRTWKEWRSGSKVNCWEVHKGADHVDRKGFYFVCENGVPTGDVHVVLPGNFFEVSASGHGKKSGELMQNDAKAMEAYKKYFGKYVNK